MTAAPTSKFKFMVIVLICGVLAVNSTHGFVHCQSADGHSRIEFAGNAGCQGAADTGCRDESGHSQTAFINSAGGCGPCLDTFIPTDVITSFQPVKTLSETAILPVLSNQSIDLGMFGPQRPFIEPVALADFALVPIRTVILLI